MSDRPTDYTTQIRTIVATYRLGYYFNPGGVEFFDPAHPSIPHCQTSEYAEREDWEKLAAWVEKYKDALAAPVGPKPYVWYSEGQWPVIKGRYFHRCTLSWQQMGEDGQVHDISHEYEDIEELEDGSGWRLLCADGNSAENILLKPDNTESRAYWENRLFTNAP